jgi:hypothetical protein
LIQQKSTIFIASRLRQKKNNLVVAVAFVVWTQARAFLQNNALAIKNVCSVSWTLLAHLPTYVHM